ncbi:MAG: phosphate acetyltransferase [Candidatus Nomurabacteria bacterium]|jgi:phosphate acetyltransferase|nr:phosphate acetyltransferase [Candidatus Nomurabacteria bacterium]
MSLVGDLKKRIKTPVKIVFPEGDHPRIQEAAKLAQKDGICEAVLIGSDTENTLQVAADMAANGEADGIVAGIDYTSRDVILAARDAIGLEPGLKTFSSLFFMEFPDGKLVTLADCATCKHPTADQLVDIVKATDKTVQTVLRVKPKVALLSFSTYGSGGKDHTIDTAREALEKLRAEYPHIVVDGEMQLDAAVHSEIGAKKAPSSPVAGQANVLVVPDINTGNVLYKALQQFAGAKAYGPILQGFAKPVSDLSRGATVDDIYGVIAVTALQAT